MPFVIKAFDKYYIRDREDHIEEIYDLDQATVFISKKEAEAICNQSNLAEYFKIIDIVPEKEKYDAWKTEGMIRRTLPKIDKKMSRKYNGESIPEIIKFFKYVSENEDKVAQKDYETWPKLYAKAAILFDFVSYWDKAYTKKTHSVSITVKKDSDYSIFEKELNLALPHITHIEDGYYIIPIMDHELSMYESRNLLIKVAEGPIRHHHACKISGNRYREIYKGSLIDCFKDIKNNYYYD